MTISFRSAATALVALSLSAPLAAQDAETPNLDQVLAVVNGTEITLGHVAVAKASLPNEYRSYPSDVLFPGILDQLIQQTALAQSHTGDLPKRVKLAIENETRSLTAGEVVESVLAAPIDDAKVQEAYDTFAAGSEGEEFRASHILVETEEEALAIIADLEGGADFAETAKEKSTGPSGSNGGDLGWFGAGQMVPAFEAATMALAPGEISAPVETQFGFHVILLADKRDSAAPSLEEVRDDIEIDLRREAVRVHIEALMKTVDVDRSGTENVDPSVLDQIDLTKLP